MDEPGEDGRSECGGGADGDGENYLDKGGGDMEEGEQGKEGTAGQDASTVYDAFLLFHGCPDNYFAWFAW